MLTDIFAARYRTIELFPSFTEAERRLLVQCLRLMTEQLRPSDERSFWSDLHRRLSMELGLERLWSDVHKHVRGRSVLNTQEMCRQFTLVKFDVRWDADAFVKTRLSLVELGFRRMGEEVQAANARLDAEIKNLEQTLSALTSSFGRGPVAFKEVDTLKAHNAHLNTLFNDTVHELNERLRQAGVLLHYHNGFFQISADALTTDQIDDPFWRAVTSARWKSVDTDMKEAIDTRDNGGRDPA
jgi:AbiJ N-terminal domain 4